MKKKDALDIPDFLRVTQTDRGEEWQLRNRVAAQSLPSTAGLIFAPKEHAPEVVAFIETAEAEKREAFDKRMRNAKDRAAAQKRASERAEAEARRADEEYVRKFSASWREYQEIAGKGTAAPKPEQVVRISGGAVERVAPDSPPASSRASSLENARITGVGPNQRKPGTKAHAKYEEMAAFVKKNPGCKAGEVFAATTYAEGDLRWDVGRDVVKITHLNIV